MSTVEESKLKSGGERLFGLVVCGPCACGKSEVASALADHFEAPFVDADSFHSESNIKKMSNGVPLTDQDRFPWLVTVRQEMVQQGVKLIKGSEDSSRRVAVVAACSALKKQYRDILRGMNTHKNPSSTPAPHNQALSTIFVFLNCSEAVLQKRLSERQGHFMKGNMLASQLATLELPQNDEQDHAIIVDGDKPLNNVVEEAIEKIVKLIFSSIPNMT